MGRILGSRLGCALLLLLLASPAGAFTTWTVDNNNASGPNSMKAANDGAVAGDLVNVAWLSGGYSVAPNPANSGTDSLTNRITYIGNQDNPTDPTTAVIINADLNISKNGIRLIGFYSVNEIGINGTAASLARWSSIERSTCEDGCTLKWINNSGLLYCTIGRYSGNASDRTFALKNGNRHPYVIGCTFKTSMNDMTDNALGSWCINDEFSQPEGRTDSTDADTIHFCQYARIDSNSIEVKLRGSSCNAAGDELVRNAIKIRQLRYSTFKYNTITVYDSSTGNCVGIRKLGWWMRDYVNGVDFTGTTWTFKGDNSAKWRIDVTNDGNAGGALDPSWLTFVDCVWNNQGGTSSGGQGFDWRGGMNNVYMRRCSFVGSSTAGGTYVNDMNGANDIQYCNFVSTKTGGDKPALTIICTTPATTSLILKNNIIYAQPSPVSGTFAPLVILSKPMAYTANYNCYTNLSSTSESVRYQGVNRSIVFMCGSPVASDCNSISASPGFTDSTAATYNNALLSGSRCRMAGESGTDIGVAQPSTDVTVPSAITNLAAYQIAPDSSFALYFTAPGDDAGGGGKVTSYVVKADTVSISDNTTFAAALTIATTETIVIPGAIQGFRVDGSVLAAYTAIVTNKFWSFAVKAYDEAGNASTISNLCSGVAFPPIGRSGEGDIDHIEAEP